MVEGFAKGVKYSLFLANIVIFMGGLVVFSIGVWTLADKSFMERLLGSNLYVASAAILIATGVVVAVISFLGTLGAYKEVKCMLVTFFVILFMIFVVMMVGGILGYIFRSEVDERMHAEMINSIKLYSEDTGVTEAWDAVQRSFECCGVLPYANEPPPDKTKRLDKAHEIWTVEGKGNGKFKANKLPDSCCISPPSKPMKPKSAGPIQQQTNTNANCNAKLPFYEESCYERMKEFVKGHALLVGGIGIGISCLLVIGMILSCALFFMI